MTRSDAECESCLTGAIRYWIYQFHISPEDAKDCAQEFLIKGFCVSSEMREKRANGTCNERYIFKCAKNHGFDFKEKHRLQEEIEVHFTPKEWEDIRNNSDIPDPERELIRKGFLETMDEMAETLTPRQRDLYRRYFRNGESVRVIAHYLGQSEQSVRQSLYRLKNRLIGLIRNKG